MQSENCLKCGAMCDSLLHSGDFLAAVTLLGDCKTCRERFETVIDGIEKLVTIAPEFSGDAAEGLHRSGAEAARCDECRTRAFGPGIMLPDWQSVGRYRLLELVEEGGEGRLYRAWDPEMSRMVALKIRQHLPAGSIYEWTDEGSLLSQVQHENLVQIFDLGMNEGCSFIVMEWLDGYTLRQLANRERLSLETIIELMLQLSAVVETLHHRGIVHLDLKPDNVIVVRREQDYIVKLIDFGLAWRFGRTSLPGEFIAGTPGFMAPEQVQGHSGSWGPPTDVFGLGAILAFLLQAIDNREASGSTIAGPTSNRTRADNARLHAAVVRVCEQASSTDPARRYQNGGQVRSALMQARFPRRQSSRFARIAAAVIVLGGFLSFPCWSSHSRTAVAVESTTRPAESLLFPATQVIDLTASLVDTEGAGLWLWSRTTGPVEWKGKRKQISVSQFQYTSGENGLEIASSLRLHLGILAVDIPQKSSAECVTEELSEMLHGLKSSWPEEASVRINANGIKIDQAPLTTAEVDVLNQCRRYLEAKTRRFDLVLLPVPTKPASMRRRSVSLSVIDP